MAIRDRDLAAREESSSSMLPLHMHRVSWIVGAEGLEIFVVGARRRFG